MIKLFHQINKPAAVAPGTLYFRGERKLEHPTIKVIDYSGDRFSERDIDDVHDCFPYKDTDSTTWIDIRGLHDTELLREIGTHFGLRSLLLEDIVNTHQRPKAEEDTDSVFTVCRVLDFDSETSILKSEQVSLVLLPNVLLSFQENSGDIFEPVRERLRQGFKRVRTGSAGFLCYALLDAVVDRYFTVLERLSEKIESLEEELLLEPGADALQRIHRLRRQIVLLRRAIWPLRDVMLELDRGEIPLFGKETAPYLRDLYSHVIHVVDTVDSFREILSSLQELYLSSLSNRMNSVMKVLTVFATIFVPLTFLTGVYGMNFKYFPELGWRWSYPAFWIISLVSCFVLLVYFRRKRWL